MLILYVDLVTPATANLRKEIYENLRSKAYQSRNLATTIKPLITFPLNLLTCTCVGILPGRVEPTSSIALTTSRTEALHARRSCANSLDTLTQSFLHRAWPKTRGSEIGSRSALIVEPHVFSWPPGGVGKRRSCRTTKPPGFFARAVPVYF